MPPELEKQKKGEIVVPDDPETIDPKKANPSDVDWGALALSDDDTADVPVKVPDTRADLTDETESETPQLEEGDYPADDSDDEDDDAALDATEDETPDASAANTEEQPAPTPQPVTTKPVQAPVEGTRVDPVALQRQQQAQRQAMYGRLVKQYTLTPKMTEDLVDSPEKVLPHLLARVHLEAFESAQQAFMQRVPQVIRQHSVQETVQRQNEEAFYSRWPNLRAAVEADPAKHAELIRMARATRQVNPNATKEDLIRMVGAQAHVGWGIPLEDQTRETVTETPKNVRHFKPASPGGSRVAPKPAKRASSNPFTQLAEELLDDDLL